MPAENGTLITPMKRIYTDQSFYAVMINIMQSWRWSWAREFYDSISNEKSNAGSFISCRTVPGVDKTVILFLLRIKKNYTILHEQIL